MINFYFIQIKLRCYIFFVYLCNRIKIISPPPNPKNKSRPQKAPR